MRCPCGRNYEDPPPPPRIPKNIKKAMAERDAALKQMERQGKELAMIRAQVQRLKKNMPMDDPHGPEET